MNNNGIQFEHNGFECVINERPDLCYLYKVHGHRETDDKDWTSNVLFERYITAEQIANACSDIIDGTFSGKVEQCGAYNVMAGVR